MTFLRSFARPVLLAWLLVFALILAGPASVSARVEMLDGRDGVEGDPGDSFGGTGGGGDYDIGGSDVVAGDQPTRRNPCLPVFVIFDPRTGPLVIFIRPMTIEGTPWEKVNLWGGAK